MHRVHRSWLLVNFIGLLITGDVSATALYDNKDRVLDQTGGAKINLRRRRSRLSRERNIQGDLVPVIIGIDDSSDGVLDKIYSRLTTFVRPKFNRINALSALVSRDELYELEQDPNVQYIEDDPMVYPDSSETTLYGLRMVQAFAPIISKKNFTGTAACNNPNSFKIGIVDSGLAM